VYSTIPGIKASLQRFCFEFHAFRRAGKNDSAGCIKAHWRHPEESGTIESDLERDALVIVQGRRDQRAIQVVEGDLETRGAEWRSCGCESGQR
jgi:hypothetical protein